MQYKIFTKPLNVKIQQNTFQRYKSIWKRLICYVGRTCDPSMSTRPLYKATDAQKRRFSDMMHAAELARNAPECDPAHPHFIKMLDRCVLQLSIELLDHQLYGDEYESAIVSFLAVLGIDPKEENFKDPRNYQSDLTIGSLKSRVLLRRSAYAKSH